MNLILWLLLCLLEITIRPVSSGSSLSPSQPNATFAKPGCKDTCGGVDIPFPFGIGHDCFFDPWFEITCSSDKSKTRPVLTKLNIPVFYIEFRENQHPTITVEIPPFNMCSSAVQNSINLTSSPYSYPATSNVFVMQGCPGSSFLKTPYNNEIIAGCATLCDNTTKTSICRGVNCCQSALMPLSSAMSDGIYYFEVQLDNQTSTTDCFVSSLVSSSSYSSALSLNSTVLAWNMRYTESAFLAFNNSSSCITFLTETICECEPGHRGNPFLPNGCEVAEECKNCQDRCVAGVGDDTGNFYCREERKKPIMTSPPMLGFVIGTGVVLLVASCYWMYHFLKKRRDIKRKADYFKRNGGLILQQQLSSEEGGLEKAKVFTSDELEKATDHFNQDRILGQGGQGTVYKGMLTDGKIVAIKKSKQVNETQLGQFINEVVILSQINHRHVVKVLGCCLESELPLLVYEFIPNGTLAERIHDPDDDLHLTWNMRMKIASESAAAVAYLHSSSSPPIYHRDIKSSNILLDEKNRAKVADFGSSKTIAIDQTHLTTNVQGTMGYLDPEYFQTYQFNAKSDVYSFGVVLLELLTSKKPIYRGETLEQKNLVTEFLFAMESGHLREFIDPQLFEQTREEEILVVADLARQCLGWTSKMRPTMKQVTTILETIIQSPTQMPLL